MRPTASTTPDRPSVLYLIDSPDATTIVERLLASLDQRSEPASASVDANAAAIRELLARIVALEYAGFTCHLAPLDAEVIRRAAEQRPSLMVLDVTRYGTVVKRMHNVLRTHADTRETPLIVLTSDTRASGAAKKIGCEAYLTKPAQPIKFFGEIGRVIAGMCHSPDPVVS